MKVSYNWLQEYVDFDYTPEELAHQLTLAGLEVDGVEYQGEEITDIVVGEIKDIAEHENADKLSVCKVDIAQQELQIVCGATNMEIGDKVPVAPVGTVMPDGMEIKEVELRGVRSWGMMCSTDELKLADDGVDGLFILSEDVEVGNKLVEELGLDDIIIELDLTPNYAHCLSMVGVAREVAALAGTEVKMPEAEVEEIEEQIKDWVKVEVADDELAPRYAGRIITGVEVKDSPRWLKKRLEAIGVRPVNNIVDVTNFVLMELGQPLHAFDYEQIAGQKIVVRRANSEEELVTLDDQQRELDEEMLVIADDQKPICLAGVMGGLNSEVDQQTTTIFLESANFVPGVVRSTAKKLGIHSDASHRFERGVDINLADVALERATELIAKICGGQVINGIIDLYPTEVEEEVFTLNPKRVKKLLGVDLTAEDIKDLLEKLNFEVEGAEELTVKVPTYRVDINQKIDLVEEVARSYGYDQIEPIKPTGDIIQGKKTWPQKIEDRTRNILTDLGLFEVQNYSFISPTAFDQINLPEDSQLREVVKLGNPISQDYSVLRTTLLPNLLENIQLNLNRNVEEVSIFELGKVFIPTVEQELPLEELKLSAAVLKEGLIDSWNLDAAGFFYLKGILEDYFASLGIEEVNFVANEHPSLHPGRTAKLEVAGEMIGYLGEVHPEVLDNYDLNQRVTVFELDFSAIVKAATDIREYSQLPKYPALTRDIALVVKEEVTNQEIKDVILEIGDQILESIKLFDLYQGEQVPEGHKSLAYSLNYRVATRTLTDEEVNQVQAKIEEELDQRLGAKIRQ
ncbi:phenylalanine--tRNA ligase subunit beta [Natroniella sulfidigena]|uniref:phenylalanine--tRNA ligase subunit beta n=1 Tax=Natroniella sulfidigena TaxID=723921 RepID=UPI00200ADB68|nr:phenylalanine--tRNA ligase subunit beta [Natroniella sulfidigena]MCK8817110.1 phenylalanine--tRNA ligase subunit beta [Natroniella sulfidigena]